MDHKCPDGYVDCDDDDDVDGGVDGDDDGYGDDADDDDIGVGPKCAKVCVWQKKRVGDISETDLGRHVRRTGSGQYCF